MSLSVFDILRRTGRLALSAHFVLVLANVSAARANETIATRDTSRMVSIGGSVTEILYELGLRESIVAVDTTSLFPPDAMKEKKNVGYMRQLSPEGVLGLAPSLILALEGTGPKETMAVLKQAGVPLVVVPDRFSGEGIIEKIEMVASTVGAGARGRCLSERVNADLNALQSLEAGITKRKRVLFVMSLVADRVMVAGHNTAADGIIRMAGAVNAIGEFDGYKQVGAEAVVAAQPDVVLVMERGNGTLTADAVFSHPAFTATPAATGRAFVSMDGLYLLGFGPRSARAARDLALALNTQLSSGQCPSEKAGAEACPTP